MNTQQTHVFACIDGAGLTQAVCDYAVWISRRVEAPLELLHTIDHHHETAITANLSGNIGLGSQEHLLKEISELEQQQSKLQLQKGKLLLQAAKDHVREAGISDPICSKRHGGLIESLIELEDHIRVLVLGVRGQAHDSQTNKLGSQLEAVIRSLHRPILIVTGAFKMPQRIMIAYDGSKSADKAVEMVVTSPLYRGLNCHLVCVNKNEHTADTLLEQATDKLQAAGHLDITSIKLKGKADQALCDYQQHHDIDLTIMGAFSHHRLHDVVLGSFTHKMLVNTNKPLLLLR